MPQLILAMQVTIVLPRPLLQFGERTAMNGLRFPVFPVFPVVNSCSSRRYLIDRVGAVLAVHFAPAEWGVEDADEAQVFAGGA